MNGLSESELLWYYMVMRGNWMKLNMNLV